MYISHSLGDVLRLCDRVLVMSAGRIQTCLHKSDFDREAILRCAFP
jgi:ABC-type sugar transport system ATPase subunit